MVACHHEEADEKQAWPVALFKLAQPVQTRKEKQERPHQGKPEDCQVGGRQRACRDAHERKSIRPDEEQPDQAEIDQRCLSVTHQSVFGPQSAFTLRSGARTIIATAMLGTM